jgi:hypothetical protein
VNPVILVTRSIFDVQSINPVPKHMAGLPAVARVLPFESVRNAESIASQVPGVRVPDGPLDRMRRTEGQESEVGEGIAMRTPPSPSWMDFADGPDV